MAINKLIQTTVSHRHQTVVPTPIRNKYNIEEGSKILWVDKGDKIEIIPLKSSLKAPFRGAGRGSGLLEELLANRAIEREREWKNE